MSDDETIEEEEVVEAVPSWSTIRGCKISIPPRNWYIGQPWTPETLELIKQMSEE